jgi:hypothetical protein
MGPLPVSFTTKCVAGDLLCHGKQKSFLLHCNIIMLHYHQLMCICNHVPAANTCMSPLSLHTYRHPKHTATPNMWRLLMVWGLLLVLSAGSVLTM